MSIYRTPASVKTLLSAFTRLTADRKLRWFGTIADDGKYEERTAYHDGFTIRLRVFKTGTCLASISHSKMDRPVSYESQAGGGEHAVPEIDELVKAVSERYEFQTATHPDNQALEALIKD